MSKHFTAACISNGYAAMGNSLRRPRHKAPSRRNISEAIAAEARRAARMNAAKKKK